MRELSSEAGASGQTAQTRHRRGGRDDMAVPEAEFRSYYGRQILKTPVWNWMIAAYLFSGGLSAGSAMLAAGADLTGRPGLRKVSRLGALAGLLASMYFLIGDLGRPERFHHMLRVAKPSSPMSIGTWILSGYGPGAGLAGVAELMPRRLRRTRLGRLLDWAARPAGLEAAAVAPGLASYTAVLLSHTAVPAWREAHPYLPFIFTGSAAASGGGLALLLAPAGETGPARRMAVAGTAVEVAASRAMERRLGLVGEAYTTGRPHRLRQLSEALTVGGAAGAVLGGRRPSVLALSGAALLAGSALQRFGVFEAGVASTQDPKYVVVPQRERLAAGEPASGQG
ncbi:polysulfide reductase [Mycobacterium sp. PS03-16]|uniref:NrfD/PsrC family molybdoenzyme membrane anchor subunit n=1 Tax=Mycobacterium sp. PS03-16 TaxID=2559611 RepID=UPI00107409A6|nr:NrfD/PsrC family molybdoenzyme membrane anchor subunit [Mycobacterium sp. PS03-16]TFV54745.1 polysulfide reductase [Mycobacterium sp. PS03-16]